MTLNVTLSAFAAERRSAPASIGQYLLSAGRSASNPPVAVASVYRYTDNGRPTATQTLLRVLCSQRQKNCLEMRLPITSLGQQFAGKTRSSAIAE